MEHTVFREFLVDERVLSICPYGNGHINDTFLVQTEQGKYILQRINHAVFPDMAGLMENLSAVCAHIAKKHRTTEIVSLRNGGLYCTHNEDYYRVMTFMEGETLDAPTSAEDMYLAGLAFGAFQQDMADFDAERLIDIIPNFHNTEKRLADFKRAIEEDKLHRREQCQPLIEDYLGRSHYASVVTNQLAAGGIPCRVTHNDTKLNNVILDKKKHVPVCVIDLDTVMKGSLLYDFGDAVRSGGKKASEEEGDPERNRLELSYFRAFAKGFLEKTREILTKTERELLWFSPLLMTYECGMRFLTDYLQGDTYFRPKQKGLNLARAKYHFAYLQDMENKEKYIKESINELL